jgi:hypothetical protein
MDLRFLEKLYHFIDKNLIFILIFLFSLLFIKIIIKRKFKNIRNVLLIINFILIIFLIHVFFKILYKIIILKFYNELFFLIAFFLIPILMKYTPIILKKYDHLVDKFINK